VPGHGRQQELLLDLKVARALALEEVEERRACLGSALACRPLSFMDANSPW
jgi:hypothetical protein